MTTIEIMDELDKFINNSTDRKELWDLHIFLHVKASSAQLKSFELAKKEVEKLVDGQSI